MTNDRGQVRRNPWRFIWISIGILGGAMLILGTLGSPGGLVIKGAKILGNLVSPGGLGIKGAQTVKVERDRNWRVTKYSIDRSDGRTAWDWLGLIGVPATLAALGIWFQSQEQKRASQEAKEQRRLVAEENKEETLQRYFDRVAQLLIEKDLIGLSSSSEQPNSVVESSSDVIRARTLSVLRSFSEDGARKASVVLFLHETEILQKLNVSLLKADLSGVNLIYANLSGADLIGANLSEANLTWANLSGAKLSGVYLSRANLSYANLSGADLNEASLFGADLTWANLSGANISRANLSGANLSWANLSGADLNGASLSEVQWDETTKWPDKAAFEGARYIPLQLKTMLGLD